ncbi:MAG TPA: hypothetical protein VNY05_30535 [Candidatus Acidoferrales bacterium]|jgi:hypothetical protein|nr:hypothetical protein [Candidatus Acidoferrales bacterium]
MNARQAKQLRSDKELLKRLTKYIALHSFRNTALEDLHAGTHPGSSAGDYSDVKVVSPYGEIPWTRVSRFGDHEMKTLMIDVVNHTYMTMTTLFDMPDSAVDFLFSCLREHDPAPGWNEPRLPS